VRVRVGGWVGRVGRSDGGWTDGWMNEWPTPRMFCHFLFINFYSVNNLN